MEVNTDPIFKKSYYYLKKIVEQNKKRYNKKAKHYLERSIVRGKTKKP